MLLFILGFMCCWYIIAIIVVFANIDIFPIFFNVITFPVWIIIMPVCYVIVFIRLIKFKIMNLLKKK